MELTLDAGCWYEDYGRTKVVCCDLGSRDTGWLVAESGSGYMGWDGWIDYLPGGSKFLMAPRKLLIL